MKWVQERCNRFVTEQKGAAAFEERMRPREAKVTVQPPQLFGTKGGGGQAFAMKWDGLSEIFESVTVLTGAGLRNGEKPGSGERTRRASVAETGLAPLHGGSQRPFRAVVGRLHTWLVKKTE